MINKVTFMGQNHKDAPSSFLITFPPSLFKKKKR